MIQVDCLYTSLTQIPSSALRSPYEHLIKPIDLDLGLTPGTKYQLVGLSTTNGAAFVFVRELRPNRFLSVYPAPLFELDWTQLDSEYALRISKHTGTFELLYRPLACIPNWFERYCDDDPEVVRILDGIGERVP
jgi:hypothetical protein